MLLTPLLPCLATLLFATTLADTWYEEYESADAATHVIALWQFNSGGELEDSSGNGHHLELNGAKLTEEGKFGGGLRSFAGWPQADQRHAAVARAHPDLSPSGPFSIDLTAMP